MISVEKKADCCGCSACYNICQKEAIIMTPDEEGFLYPKVDLSKCVDCKLCEKVCPVIEPPKVSEKIEASVIAQSHDEDVLDESTSGGFIDALYKYMITEKAGYAVGVRYDNHFMPAHVIVDKYEDARPFRNSKYAQSYLGDIFRNVQKLLNRNEDVIFVGTPCQIAGLKKFLQKDYASLITVDLVCRSIPSPKFWEEYLTWQERRYNSKIKRLFCRKKTYGYHSGTLVIEFENGRKYSGSNRVDYYMKAFHSDICSRPSCYECKFKSAHRCSDFTVFDSWKAGQVSNGEVEDNDKGFSNVIVHTEKGKKILGLIKDIDIWEADAKKMFDFTGSMHSQSIAMPEKRLSFYDNLGKYDFEQAMKLMISVTYLDLAIERIKPIREVVRTVMRIFDNL